MSKSVVPCIMCQLKRPIGTENNDLTKSHGYYCEWFNVRITPDEASNPHSDIRTMCLSQGNFFRWVTPGVSAHDYAASLREQLEWVERGKSVRYALYSVLVALVAVVAALPFVG